MGTPAKRSIAMTENKTKTFMLCYVMLLCSLSRFYIIKSNKVNSSVYWSFGLVSRFPDCSYEVWSCVCELGRHRWLTVCRWCQPHHLQYVFVEVDGEWCLCHFYFFLSPPFLFCLFSPFPTILSFVSWAHPLSLFLSPLFISHISPLCI